MLTPRSTLNRRLIAALDASPSRIPVLLGGCGTGRTTLLHQLRERLGPEDLDALLDPLPHIANLGGVYDRLEKLEVSGG